MAAAQAGGGASLASWGRACLRAVFAGPIALIVSILILLAMPLWFPVGIGGIDHLVMPVVTFPLTWAVLFFHACLDRRLLRVVLVSLILGAVNFALIVEKFSGAPAS